MAGAYLSGSVALGDFDPVTSDIDLFVVAGSPVDERARHRVVDSMLDPPMAIPARGLEFVLYERDRVARPSRGGDFVVNLNLGPRMPFHLTLDPAQEPAHWFVLDRAIVRERGRPVTGPPADELFAGIPRLWVLEALRDSLAWHATEETGGLATVLNAARAVYFVRVGAWVSKSEAARWAVDNLGEKDTFATALAHRHDADARLRPEATARVLDLARAEVLSAL